jgi:hypothetical protein
MLERVSFLFFIFMSRSFSTGITWDVRIEKISYHRINRHCFVRHASVKNNGPQNLVHFTVPSFSTYSLLWLQQKTVGGSRWKGKTLSLSSYNGACGIPTFKPSLAGYKLYGCKTEWWDCWRNVALGDGDVRLRSSRRKMDKAVGTSTPHVSH